MLGGGVSQFTTTLYNATYFAGLLDANLTARSDSDLAVGDNLLAGRDTLLDDNQIALALAQRHWSLFRSRVLLDDIDI